MCYEDMEYRTAMKDYKNIVLERELAEIEKTRGPGLDRNLDNCFGRWYKSFMDEDEKIWLCQEHGLMDEDVSADWSSKYLTMSDIEKFLEDHDLVDVKMYMEFNHPDKKFKCYGHPGIPQHNWVTVKIGIRVMFANCMLFFEILEGKVIELLIYKVDQPGNYVLVHFIEYNLYEELPEDLKFYRVCQTMGFHQDNDSSLICGW